MISEQDLTRKDIELVEDYLICKGWHPPGTQGARGQSGTRGARGTSQGRGVSATRGTSQSREAGVSATPPVPKVKTQRQILKLRYDAALRNIRRFGLPHGTQLSKNDIMAFVMEGSALKPSLNVQEYMAIHPRPASEYKAQALEGFPTLDTQTLEISERDGSERSTYSNLFIRASAQIKDDGASMPLKQDLMALVIQKSKGSTVDQSESMPTYILHNSTPSAESIALVSTLFPHFTAGDRPSGATRHVPAAQRQFPAAERHFAAPGRHFPGQGPLFPQPNTKANAGDGLFDQGVPDEYRV